MALVSWVTEESSRWRATRPFFLYIFVLYDTNTFEVRRTLRSDDWAGRAIAFSPDSSKIAIGHTKIALYETETGDPVRVP